MLVTRDAAQMSLTERTTTDAPLALERSIINLGGELLYGSRAESRP